MNERIKELALEAKLRPALLLYYYRTIHGLTDTEQEELEQIEKFAELIVRECLKEIKDMIVDESERLYPNNKQTTECVNDRLLDAYDNIKEHFGVEE